MGLWKWKVMGGHVGIFEEEKKNPHLVPWIEKKRKEILLFVPVYPLQ
jgi:hypothetical protein